MRSDFMSLRFYFRICYVSSEGNERGILWFGMIISMLIQEGNKIVEQYEYVSIVMNIYFNSGTYPIFVTEE